MKVIKMNTPKGSSFHSKVVITGQVVLGFAGNLIVSETFAKSDLVKVFLFQELHQIGGVFSFLSKRERSIIMSKLKKWLKRELVRKGSAVSEREIDSDLKRK